MHTLKKLLSLVTVLILTQATHAMQNPKEENDPYEIIHQGLNNLCVPSDEIILTCNEPSTNVIKTTSSTTNECYICTLKFSSHVIEHESARLTYKYTCDSKNFLDTASAGYCTCCIKFFKEDAQIDQQEYKSGFTALHRAAYNGNSELVKILIGHGAQINHKDKRGRTALHLATCFDFSDIVKFLIDSDASINETDQYGRTALHYASRGNHAESLSILLLHGANSHLQDSKGFTSLHHAVNRRHLRIVKLILAFPFLLTAHNRFKEVFNPKRAVIKNPKEYVKTLLEITDKKNRTVLSLAENQEIEKELRLILKKPYMIY